LGTGSLAAGKDSLSRAKWVYKIKTNPDNSIERYKARLVVRGFSQKPGIDFTETFAPVAKYSSLRLQFAKAAQENLDVLQLDIKTAFLYGDLKEETYMDQPEGFSQGENLVCRLKRTLYGLKQAPRGWNNKVHTFLVRCRLHQDLRRLLRLYKIANNLPAAG
jgi:hypothetical protein